MARLIWLNGALCPAGAARIDPADRGLLLGDGVFETVCVRAGRPTHLARHLARMREGAAVLGIVPPFPDKDIRAAGEALLRAEGLAAAVLRITLTRGPGPRGLLPPDPARPTLMIAASPMPPSASAARAIVARTTRRNEHSPLSRIKSISYLDSIVARREAAASGADEAILLNTAGFVAEASAANIFLVRGGEVLTPPVADGALPGIARALILEAGIARECRLGTADLLACEAAFTTSSLGLRPLASIDGRALLAPPAALANAIGAVLR